LKLTRNFFITNIIKPYSKLVDEGGAAAAGGEAVIPETKKKLNLDILYLRLVSDGAQMQLISKKSESRYSWNDYMG